MGDTSDELLLAEYFRGSTEAFRCFFNRHRGRVGGYGRAKGLAEADVADFVQEVFLKLHRNIHAYEEGRPALPWFFTLVHNVLVDFLRRSTKRQVTDQAVQESVFYAPADPKEVCLDSLTAEQRQVVELRVLQDLSFREISVILGKTESTARKVYERSIKASYALRK